MVISDLYLLPGLKKQCANYIAQHLSPSTVIPIVMTSRLMQLSKLESICAQFIAYNLEKVIQIIECFDCIIFEFIYFKDYRQKRIQRSYSKGRGGIPFLQSFHSFNDCLYL